MLAALTGLGLSTAAGLNAYIPLLVVGLLARFTDFIRLPPEFSWMSNIWVIAGLAVLLLVEVVVDKVPIVDTVNDAIQTVIRPASGGAVFAATTAAAEVDTSAWMQEHSWVGWALGIVMSLIVHITKTTARPVVNASTGGVGAPVVSTVEDAGSLGLSLVAVFIPLLVIVALAIMAYLMFRMIRAVRRRRRRKRPDSRGQLPFERGSEAGRHPRGP